MSDQNPKRPIVLYIIGAAVIIFLINVFVYPMLLKQSAPEVDYSDFLDLVASNKVTKVTLGETHIHFTVIDSEGTEQPFRAGIWPDTDLGERLLKANIPFRRETPSDASPLISFLITMLLPALFFVAMGLLVFRLLRRMDGGSMSFGKSGAKMYVQAQTGKTFADVAGQDEAKEALVEIVDFLHNPSKYAAIGATLPKGALLVGPPGTGKTLLAKAIAGEANVPFFSISGSEFVELFVGMGAAKVRDLFKQANAKAPCIVFIDEIDTIGKKRDGLLGTGANDEREQTLNQLLSEMDGFDGKKGVVILGATNRSETLDKALLRPGRFDRRINVELPDLRGREAILKVHARMIKASPTVDYLAIAKATPGASGAELANIINEAALRAVRMGRSAISQADLEESVEVILAGMQRKNAVLTPEEKRIVAYHEIGHALVATKQPGSPPVHKITIIPRTSGALGYTMQVDEEERFLMSKEQGMAKITTLMGGRAAEELIIGSITTGAANDIETATKLARAMISRYGMSDQFGTVALEMVTNQYLGGDTALSCSNETATRIDTEVIQLIGDCYKKALSLLRANREKLRELADALYEKETMSGEEFLGILTNAVTVATDAKNQTIARKTGNTAN